MRIKALFSPLLSSFQNQMCQPCPHHSAQTHRAGISLWGAWKFSSSALLLSRKCEKSFLKSLASGQGFVARTMCLLGTRPPSSNVIAIFFLGSSFLPGKLHLLVLFLEEKNGMPLLVQGSAFRADPMLFLSKLQISVAVTVVMSMFIGFHI